MEEKILRDDLDGRQDGRDGPVVRHTLALDDDVREIDLHDENYAELQEAIRRFFENGRPRGRVGRTALRSVPTGKPARRDPEQLKAIREWANSHPQLVDGVVVKNHGRIPRDVLVKFDEHHAHPVNREKDDGGRTLFSDAQKTAAATR